MRTAAIERMDRATEPAVPCGSLLPLDRKALDAGGSTRELFCPRCEAPILQEQMREGVRIDVCARCHGTWLDCGELERLIARAVHGYNHQPRPALRHLSAREYAELFWEEA